MVRLSKLTDYASVILAQMAKKPDIFWSAGQLAEESAIEVTGEAPKLPSGPLHDAAEMVPHMPTVMMFAYSSNGLSHCKEEDTPIPHLQKTLEAFLLLIEKTVNHVAAAKV